MLAFSAAFLICTPAVWAQDDNQHVYQTYADSVAAAQKREPLGDHAFGEKVALFSGSTEFNVTDISLLRQPRARDIRFLSTQPIR